MLFMGRLKHLQNVYSLTMKRKPNYLFRNWAGNQACIAQNYYQPETEEELIKLVKDHATLRMVGTGHSWSAICLNNEALVNLDNYNKVLHLDKDKLQLTVQAGIKLWQLNEYLDQQGLALANLGSIARQSIAGAVSTGTHGSGINFQLIGSQLEQMSLIKADGQKVTLHRERDKALFNMAVVNLGALGIISEVTLNIVPAFRLHDQTVVLPFEEVVEQLDELIHNTDHFKMWWFPHSEQVVVYRYRRTQEPANDSRFRQWFMDEFLSVYMYRLLVKIGNLNRDWRKPINQMLVGKFIQPLNRIEKSYKVFNVPEPPFHREVEWSFDLQYAKELLRAYKRMVNEGPHRMNFIQEIRFTKGDDFALSPCYGRNSIWLGAYNMDNYRWEELMSDFEALAKQYNGRPHWGKEANFDKNYLQAQYPQFEAFNKLRNEWDPTGKFANAYITKIFG